MENQRLKQELKSCRCSELQKAESAEACSQVSPTPTLLSVRPSSAPADPERLLQEAGDLWREASRWESRARQREQRLLQLEQELQEKSCRTELLQRQLDDSRRQLDQWKGRQAEAEQKLRLRLQECEEGLVRQAATAPRVQVGRPNNKV